jgi:hypothetical protein
VAFSSPAPLAFAAYNDVTLTTNAVLSVNGITLNISASTSVIQSIMVNASSFSFTLGTGSSLQPDFDSAWIWGVDFCRCNKDLRGLRLRAVYLGY